ncbi:MAG: hypothetical protein ACI4SH_01100, partial [Candidatus Scatosoma sp.]
VLTVYLALAVSSLVYYISLPYKDEMQKWPKTVMFIATALLVVFLFLYMGIKYHRVKKYYKMMYYLSEGLKNVEENYFVGFELNDLQKDSVDAISCVFKTWSYKKKEWMRREAYWDVEKSLPPFEEGDMVRYVVQSNFILAYDVTEKAEKEEAEEKGTEYTQGIAAKVTEESQEEKEVKQAEENAGGEA